MCRRCATEGITTLNEVIDIPILLCKNVRGICFSSNMFNVNRFGFDAFSDGIFSDLDIS